MATLQDAKKMLKGTYAGVDATRKDLELIEQYIALPEEKRKQKQKTFQAWFAHHAAIYVGNQIQAEDSYFFPEMLKIVKGEDKGTVEYLGKQHADLKQLKTRIEEGFTPDHRAIKDLKEHVDESLQNGQSDELIKTLQAYVKAVRKHMADEEVMFVPMLLRYFTPETFKTLEMRYVRSVPLSQSKITLPWMISRLDDAQRALMLGDLPLPVRLIYQYWWEPVYLKKMKTQFDFLEE